MYKTELSRSQMLSSKAFSLDELEAARKQINEIGFAQIKTNLLPMLRNARHEFLQVYALATGRKDEVLTDEEVTALYRGPERHTWVAAYDRLRDLPIVFQIAASSELLQLVQGLGISKPVMGAKLVVRADMPYDERWDFPVHQDFCYSRSSLNSLTFWMPFQTVTKNIGALKVYPKSHLLGGNLEQVNGHMTPTAIKCLGQPEDIEVEEGNVLVFSQMLAHASGKNTSTTIRFSAQIRFADLGEPEFRNRGFKIFKPAEDGTVPPVPFKAEFAPLGRGN
jgi:hypothetical protein